MIKRTIINTLRHLKRNRISSLINIVGLSLGMACSFIILLYVIGEYSYEKDQINRDQIFRIVSYNDEQGDKAIFAINYSALATTISAELPEVEKATILEARVNRPFYVKTDKEYSIEKGTVYAVYPDYFDIVDVPILHGNPDQLISNPGSIVLSKEMAKKYYGEENPLGKTIYFQYNQEDIPYTISGIMNKMPGQSNFNPDFITRFDAQQNASIMGWKYKAYEIFIRTSSSADTSILEDKINFLGEKYHPEEKAHYLLQNAKDFHLKSDHIYGSHFEKGNRTSILIFSGIGILILLIACINYIILATAEATLRHKEIGLKKVVGASRAGLIFQIQIESLINAIIALPLALLFVERSRGIISSFFGLDLTLSYFGNWPFIIGFIVITIIVGAISGSYISFHLSRLKPIEVLHADNYKKASKPIFRKVLTGAQLVIFVSLFTSALIIQKQINFALNLRPDFDLENILIIQDDQQRINNLEVFKSELENHPDIELVSSSFSNILIRNRFMNLASSNLDPENPVLMEQYYIDKDYLETIKIQLVSGRSFISNNSSDQNQIIINETAARSMNLVDPIGKTIITKTMFSGGEKEFEIIGVVKDFLAGTAHRDIGPFILFQKSNIVPSMNIAIRLNRKLSENGKEYISERWSKMTDDKPLEFRYMDEIFREKYNKEIVLSKVIIFFSVLAIFISCLGLFGLSLFIARRKNKEIGIRKVHGAQPFDIVKMILKDFIWVIILANGIAIPITLFSMEKWLSAFAFKVRISPDIFIAGLAFSALIVCLTLIFNALRAANMNPADSIRAE